MFFLKKQTQFLADILFPKFCLGCGLPGLYICLKCQKKLKYFANNQCLFCRKRSPYGLTDIYCKEKYHLDGFWSVFEYNELMRKIIKTFKYKKAYMVWEEFKNIIDYKKLFLIKNWGTINYIQPIPLSRQKLNRRGFNQTKFIADFFSQIFKIKTVDFLIRKKDIKPQALLKKNERRRNIKGAFFLHKDTSLLKRKTILLVDDVLTTGATLNEAAKVLKENQANKVFALTLAHG